MYIHGDTLYLSGTRNKRDVFDDITKVPTFMVNHSQKYIDTENLLNSSTGGGIKNIISHSLGGRVAQTLKIITQREISKLLRMDHQTHQLITLQMLQDIATQEIIFLYLIEVLKLLVLNQIHIQLIPIQIHHIHLETRAAG